MPLWSLVPGKHIMEPEAAVLYQKKNYRSFINRIRSALKLIITRDKLLQRFTYHIRTVIVTVTEILMNIIRCLKLRKILNRLIHIEQMVSRIFKY